MRQYFWLLPLGLMPPSALAWAIIAPFQLRLARMTESRPLRWLVALVALTVFVFLTAALCGAWFQERFTATDLLAMSGASAYAIFGLAAPWFLITGRSLRDQSEKWWQASLLGNGAVIAGAIVWILVGMILGVESD